MKDQELLIAFLTACTTTWLFLIFFYMIFLNPKRLVKKRYTTKYIQFIRKNYRKRMRGIAIAIPIIILISYGIFWLVAGRPATYNHIFYLFLIFLLFVIPFPIMDYLKSKKRYKELAYETNAEIVVDIKHSKLHKFFNPVTEIFILILFILFTVILVQIPYMVYIHLGIPWIFYFTLLKTKHATLPMLRDGYLYSFIFMELNYLLVIFYIARYAIFCQHCLTFGNKLIAMMLVAIMFIRMIYYMANFRKIYSTLS